MSDMAAHATPSWAKKWAKPLAHLCGAFWHHKEDKILRQEDTVAVPELQRIQEPRRGYF